MAQGSLVLATRGSALARWQAEHVRGRLEAAGRRAEIRIVQTEGDRRTDVPLATIGGKGLFVEAIETALERGECDLAVHSLKDVPSQLAPGFVLAACLRREDPRDALIAAPGTTVRSLARGSRVGTSSLRRQAQLLRLRPDVVCVAVRGNVDTRLRRWRAGDFDALLLAAAGLERLGLSEAVAEHLDVEPFCPAAGQGVLALECRAENEAAVAAARLLADPATEACITAERAALVALGCDCHSPVGAYARIGPESGEMLLTVMVAAPDGSRFLLRQGSGRAEEVAGAAGLGREVAAALAAAGAGAILEAAARAQR